MSIFSHHSSCLHSFSINRTINLLMCVLYLAHSLKLIKFLTLSNLQLISYSIIQYFSKSLHYLLSLKSNLFPFHKAIHHNDPIPTILPLYQERFRVYPKYFPGLASASSISYNLRFNYYFLYLSYRTTFMQSGQYIFPQGREGVCVGLLFP